ncbi:hypothetical protein PIB30_042925 [Stylosanthes scabra]|uniref:RNase H type-1 domain-containing protein n=1 Tax=Stylosanthes scabra TaxID=79078 RepID=A0ABU6WIV2_9FABA|nr:hypothetical protein [Stylosanthes scabra]
MNGSPAEVIPFVHFYDSEFCIRDLWDNGSWHLDRLCIIIPQDVCIDILSYDPDRQVSYSPAKELQQIFARQHLYCHFPVNLSWKPLAQGGITVNCDACSNVLRFSCVIRDWKQGCTGTIPPFSILQGEIFAIWRGLILACDMGYKERTTNSLVDALAKLKGDYRGYEIEPMRARQLA